MHILINKLCDVIALTFLTPTSVTLLWWLQLASNTVGLNTGEDCARVQYLTGS